MRKRLHYAGHALALVALVAGCRQDMHDGAYAEPYEGSPLFADGRASRPQVEGTVARGELREDDHFWRGRVAGELAAQLPVELTAELLERGRQRYEIYCAPCHDYTGSGRGMIVQRGFKAPVSFHDPRLRESPDGYFFDVMSNGFGAMMDYSDRIHPADRWAIVAYVRALQLAWDGRIEDVPASDRARLEGEGR